MKRLLTSVLTLPLKIKAALVQIKAERAAMTENKAHMFNAINRMIAEAQTERDFKRCKLNIDLYNGLYKGREVYDQWIEALNNRKKFVKSFVVNFS